MKPNSKKLRGYKKRDALKYWSFIGDIIEEGCVKMALKIEKDITERLKNEAIE